MEDANHPSKKRRLDNRYNNPPTDSESSSDELGANSDVERRRASWAKKAETTYRAPRTYQRPQSRSETGSPDELAEDAHTYWRRRQRARSKSRSSSRESISERSQQQEESVGEASGEDDGGMSIDHPLRTPTPPPPPPPPKPERLYYKEKFVLKGHRRGVSAVQFSPDGSLIASCGRRHSIGLSVFRVISDEGEQLRTLR